MSGHPAPSQLPPVAPPWVLPTSSPCQSLVPTPTPPCFVSRIVQYGDICVWLPILSTTHVTPCTWAGVSVPPVHEWDLLHLVFDSLFTVENIQVFSGFQNYEQRCHKHARTGFVRTYFFLSLEEVPMSALVGHDDRCGSKFVSNHQTVSGVAVPFCIPISNEGGFQRLPR